MRSWLNAPASSHPHIDGLAVLLDFANICMVERDDFRGARHSDKDSVSVQGVQVAILMIFCVRERADEMSDLGTAVDIALNLTVICIGHQRDSSLKPFRSNCGVEFFVQRQQTLIA